MVLIYPVIPHRIEFFIESNFEAEAKALRKEIEEKKAEALKAADGDKKKMDFDIVRDCYVKDVKNFVFDLDVKRRNQKGELLIPNDKTPEELAEIDF